MADPTPTPRKTVKTISVSSSATGTFSAGVVSATPFPPATRETDAVSAYGDATVSNIPRPVVAQGEMSVTFLDEGQAFSEIANEVVTLSQTVAYWDGSTTNTRTFSRVCAVKGVAPGGEVSVDGERKSTVVVTLQPVGGVALSGATIPAGT